MTGSKFGFEVELIGLAKEPTPTHGASRGVLKDVLQTEAGGPSGLIQQAGGLLVQDDRSNREFTLREWEAR